MSKRQPEDKLGFYYRSRMLCDVLREMRDCCKTSNYSYLPALIEEAQHLGQAMEDGLEHSKDLARMAIDHEKGRAILKDLKARIKSHRKELGKLEPKEVKDVTSGEG